MEQPDQHPLAVTLREVGGDDLERFFEHQIDPEASRMAAFPPRDRDTFMAHWAKILADPEVDVQTVVYGDRAVGHVVSWRQSGMRLIGYWIDRSEWGRGIATRGLALFVERTADRPVHAYVAVSNVASLRVLAKVGFQYVGGEGGVPVVGDDGVAEVLLVLEN